MLDSVLVGVDGRQGGRDAIALAEELAPRGATVTVVHVYGGSTMGGRMQAQARMSTNPLTVYDSSVARGLHTAALEHGADLLVVGSCHRGRLGQLVLGNDTLSTLDDAPCAIAIAPKGYAGAAHRLAVLGVGFDGSPESDQALAGARAIAAQHGATITAMSVIPLKGTADSKRSHDDSPGIARQLGDAERRRLRDLGEVEGEVSYGEPGEQLASFGKTVDLLVVGSRSVGPMLRWLTGSASRHLARHVKCPLLVFPRGAADQVLRAAHSTAAPA